MTNFIKGILWTVFTYYAINTQEFFLIWLSVITLIVALSGGKNGSKNKVN